MITDTITNATCYAALHPDFADAIQLLQTLDFTALPDGQVPCANPNIRLFVGSEPMRSKAEAKPEAHLKHIDIQVPISGEETYGWIDRGRLKNGLGYDEKRDIEFFDGRVRPLLPQRRARPAGGRRKNHTQSRL